MGEAYDLHDVCRTAYGNVLGVTYVEIIGHKAVVADIIYLRPREVVQWGSGRRYSVAYLYLGAGRPEISIYVTPLTITTVLLYRFETHAE